MSIKQIWYLIMAWIFAISGGVTAYKGDYAQACFYLIVSNACWFEVKFDDLLSKLEEK